MKKEKEKTTKDRFILLCVDISDTSDGFPEKIGGPFDTPEKAAEEMRKDVYAYAGERESDYVAITIQSDKAEVWFDSMKGVGCKWSVVWL